jgi:integrase
MDPRNFRVLFETAYRTGRRITSVLGLCGQDIDFPRPWITWRAEIDKRRKTWRTPPPKKLAPDRDKHRATMLADHKISSSFTRTTTHAHSRRITPTHSSS